MKISIRDLHKSYALDDASSWSGKARPPSHLSDRPATPTAKVEPAANPAICTVKLRPTRGNPLAIRSRRGVPAPPGQPLPHGTESARSRQSSAAKAS